MLKKMLFLWVSECGQEWAERPSPTVKRHWKKVVIKLYSLDPGVVCRMSLSGRQYEVILRTVR